ncbi:MAG: cytidylate kinase family protein [bacterium]
MKPQIITIAGSIGSGKSSTAKAVAAALGYEHFSSGDLFRQIAAERGLSIEAMNLSLEERNDVDHGVDELLKNMNGKEKLVIDSRLAFHWIPESFKVFLYVDPQSAAERIYAHIRDQGRVSQEGSSAAEIRENTEVRTASETRRYSALYGVNVYDTTQFDAVINTTHNNLETVVAMVLGAFRGWQSASA